MALAPEMAFTHIGIFVRDTGPMTSFYTDVLGFMITDRATIRGADVVFLSRSPTEHHQIVLVPGRGPDQPSTVNQISFRMVSLRELRRFHGQLVALGVAGIEPINHGSAWAVYFRDPEGNRIEVSTPTPWYAPPVSVPLDMSLSDEELHRRTEAMVLGSPGHMKRDEWVARTRLRLESEGRLEHRA